MSVMSNIKRVINSNASTGGSSSVPPLDLSKGKKDSVSTATPGSARTEVTPSTVSALSTASVNTLSTPVTEQVMGKKEATTNNANKPSDRFTAPGFDAKYLEALFEYKDLKFHDICDYIRTEYNVISQVIASIVIKDEEKQKFYEPRLKHLKAELRGIVEYAKLYDIALI
jgi:hypothetical protein